MYVTTVLLLKIFYNKCCLNLPWKVHQMCNDLKFDAPAYIKVMKFFLLVVTTLSLQVSVGRCCDLQCLPLFVLLLLMFWQWVHLVLKLIWQLGMVELFLLACWSTEDVSSCMQFCQCVVAKRVCSYTLTVGTFGYCILE